MSRKAIQVLTKIYFFDICLKGIFIKILKFPHHKKLSIAEKFLKKQLIPLTKLRQVKLFRKNIDMS